MTKKSIDTIVWWIPFKKTRNAVREYLETIYEAVHKLNRGALPRYMYAEPEDIEYIDFEIFDKIYKVLPTPIWDYCSRGEWEPQTINIYRKYLNKDKLYIDIGAFVGLTPYIANALGCNNIVAVEAHPYTCKFFERSIYKNSLEKNIRLFNLAITNKDNDIINFGYTRETGRPNDLPSDSSIRQGEFKISTTTLSTLIQKNNLSNIGFIKIDIEGAETLIIDSLIELSNYNEIFIWLSIHPPFWTNKKKCADSLIDVIKLFELRDDNDNQLSTDNLRQMMLTDEKFPKWGSNMGNFFEVLLISKSK